MSSKARQKGYRSVKAVRDVLEADGYIVGNVERNSKFSKERDLFGLWDLLAVRGRQHIYIQVKTNLSIGKKKPTKWLEPYIAWGKEHGSEHVLCQVHVKYDGAGIKVVECK